MGSKGLKAIIIDSAGSGTPLGRLSGAGSTVVGKVLNISSGPAVKGQNMADFDPRAMNRITEGIPERRWESAGGAPGAVITDKAIKVDPETKQCTVCEEVG